MREVAAVLSIDLETVLHWHLPPDRSMVAIPDSSELWDIVWFNKDRIGGVAHTHPGRGFPSPSQEDATTWQAIEQGLGKRLFWPIVTEDSFAIFRMEDTEAVRTFAYGTGQSMHMAWMDLLRKFSGYR